MPAIGNITINDGMPTPVARTFGPSGIDSNEVAGYADRAGGIPIGYGVITILLRKPSDLQRGVYKATVKLLLPTLEQTSASTATGIQPAPTVAYTTAMHADFLLPSRSTTQERKNLRVLGMNLFNHATLTAVIENLESVY